MRIYSLFVLVALALSLTAANAYGTNSNATEFMSIEEVILSVRESIVNAEKKAKTQSGQTGDPVFTGRTFELELKVGIQKKDGGGVFLRVLDFIGGNLEKSKQSETVHTIKLIFDMKAAIRNKPPRSSGVAGETEREQTQSEPQTRRGE